MMYDEMIVCTRVCVVQVGLCIRYIHVCVYVYVMYVVCVQKFTASGQYQCISIS